ncbi:hypothetical protein D915_004990 [Fasciola hepatica]|uniref:Uncharacterized protein n=1 Tax=Fasciola hepatica TaxID=6192 RepID=A0A4E0RZ14_FASHE|nr:hypothetical protein D915_004990 [Fasciola hepatica]
MIRTLIYLCISLQFRRITLTNFNVPYEREKKLNFTSSRGRRVMKRGKLLVPIMLLFSDYASPRGGMYRGRDRGMNPGWYDGGRGRGEPGMGFRGGGQFRGRGYPRGRGSRGGYGDSRGTSRGGPRGYRSDEQEHTNGEKQSNGHEGQSE